LIFNKSENLCFVFHLTVYLVESLDDISLDQIFSILFMLSSLYSEQLSYHLLHSLGKMGSDCPAIASDITGGNYAFIVEVSEISFENSFEFHRPQV